MTIVDDLLSNRWSEENAIGTAIPFEMRPQRGVQTRITSSNERLLTQFKSGRPDLKSKQLVAFVCGDPFLVWFQPQFYLRWTLR